MRKLLAIGLAMILLIGLLSACSSNDTSTESGDGPVKLTLWHPEGDTSDAYKEMIKEFNKEHEGEIEAEITFIPRGNKYAYEDKISAAATSDTLPDLLSLDGPNVANYADAGIIQPIEGLVENQDDFVDSIIKQGTYKDKLYTVGPTESTVALFYNVKMLEEAGITPPTSLEEAWTWDEFYEAAKKLTNKEKGIYGVNWTLDYGADSGDVRKAFVNGEGAMNIIGTFSLPEIEELNEHFNYGIFPFPATNDPLKNKVLGGVDVGLVISADTQYPEEAKKFLSFLMETKNAQIFSDFEGSISAVKGVEMKKQEVRHIELFVKQGKGVNWPNHYWIGGTAAEDDFRKLSQQFFMDGNVSAYLENLDKMFSSHRKVE